MANKKISQLISVSTPTIGDLLPIVNSGETKNISLGDMSDFINNESLSSYGFIIQPNIINKNILLPENSNIIYLSSLTMGNNYTLTIPNTSTLIIYE